MAGDLVYNVAKGRAAELYQRVRAGDPSTSGLVVALINTPATDGAMRDCATFAAVLALASTTELANAGYSRKVLTAADSLPALVVNNTDDRQEIGAALGAISFGNIAAGTNITNVIISYAPNTAGATSTWIPLTCHAWAVSPNGTLIAPTVEAAGFARAS